MLAAPGPAPAPALPAALIELYVEAGSSAEAVLDIRAPASDEHNGTGAAYVDLRLSGLQPGWYSLSERRLHLAADESARVLLVVHPPALENGAEPGTYDWDLDVLASSGDFSTLRGRVVVVAPGKLAFGQPPSRSQLIDFLPRHHQSDEFLARFLLIFQVAFDRIEGSIDNTHFLLDPGLTPPGFLTWLANWLDLDLSNVDDPQTQRLLIERAVELYRWKGTRRGLRAELALRLNARSLIVENFDGMRLGQDAAMGVNTQLGRRRDGCVTVTIANPADADPDFAARAEDLLQAIKPASCGYVVRCVAPSTGGQAPPSSTTQGDH